MTEGGGAAGGGTDWLAETWTVLHPQLRDLLSARLEGRTLADIGRERRMTGERARQLIVKAHGRLLEAGDLHDGNWRARLRSSAVSPAVSRADIAGVLRVADHVAVDVFAQGAGLRNPRTWAGSTRHWWAVDATTLESVLRKVLREAPFRDERLDPVAAAAGVPLGVPIREILGHGGSPVIRADDGSWLRRRARGRDAAYLWLLERGEPSRADDLRAGIDTGSVASINEALRRDTRFVRLRPEGTWALTEWTHLKVTPYSNAVEAVVAVVTEEGPMTRQALFTRVAERYPVSAWRLRQCLLSSMIGTTREGLVDLVSRGATPIEESEPDRPENMAVDPEGKVYGVRLVVDKDVTRGSGVLVHSWLTWNLGLRQAPMSRVFATGGVLGPITVKRGTTGAQMSSLRRHVLEQGMALGCHCVVLFRVDDHTARVEHTCAADCPARGVADGERPSVSGVTPVA
ncbi:RNA polymerase subunit sigma-70 [Streptomyces sp. BI20]|uniref:RNA polymerase subunit sigma-70 n=1 Tax=Streptomyces sp. BI20 TaxID=3403460 RepID=UPI003C78E1C0